jgi:hypothetical protein
MMETTHPVADWRYEVANGDTFRGYDEWREFRIEAEGESDESLTYQFDFTVVTDGITEDDALGEAMQLLADYRFAKEAATVTILAEEA